MLDGKRYYKFSQEVCVVLLCVVTLSIQNAWGKKVRQGKRRVISIQGYVVTSDPPHQHYKVIWYKLKLHSCADNVLCLRPASKLGFLA